MSSEVRAFDLSEREPQPDCREIRVSGELDLAVADQLDEALQRACRDSSQVLVSLEDCEFIDSSGIAVIIAAYRRLLADGGQLAVYGSGNQVHRVLAVTGLTENDLVFADLDGALAGLGIGASAEG